MIREAKIENRDVDPDEYHHQAADRGTAGFVLSSHVLCEILRNAQRWVLGYESPESKAKKWGDMLDCALLLPQQFQKRFAVVPVDAPRRPSVTQINAKNPSEETKRSIAWWSAWQEDHKETETISSESNAAIHAAVRRLRQDEMISDLLDHSRRQVMITALWDDKETGLTVPLKCLIDIVPNEGHLIFSNSLWDLKTTANASPYQFYKDAQRYGYHIQGAFYLAMYNAATAERRSDFGHVVQENYHPYEYRTPPPLLSQRFLNFGHLMFEKAISIYCRGLKTNRWPGYDRDVKQWPLTDCDDWFLALDSVYEEMILEEESDEDATLVGVTPRSLA